MAEPKPTSDTQPKQERIQLPEHPASQSKLPKPIWKIKNGASSSTTSSTGGVSPSPAQQSRIRPNGPLRSVTAPSKIPIASSGTNQSSSSNELPKLPTPKPQLNPSVAQAGKGSSPAISRTIIDVSERHTPQQWPVLVPTPPKTQSRSQTSSSRTTGKKPSYLDLKHRNQQYVNLFQSPGKPNHVHSTIEPSAVGDTAFLNPRLTPTPPSSARSSTFHTPISVSHEHGSSPLQLEPQNVPAARKIIRFDPANNVQSHQASPVSCTSSESSLDLFCGSHVDTHFESSPAHRLDLTPTLTVFSGADKVIMGKEAPPSPPNDTECNGVQISITETKALAADAVTGVARSDMGELTATPGCPVSSVLDVQRSKSESNHLSLKELLSPNDDSLLSLSPSISTRRIETSLTPKAAFHPQGHLPTGDLSVVSRPFPLRTSSLEQTSTSPAVRHLPELLRKSPPGPSSLRHSYTPLTTSAVDNPSSPTSSLSSTRNNSGSSLQAVVAQANVCDAGHATTTTSVEKKESVAIHKGRMNDHNKVKAVTTTNKDQSQVSSTSGVRSTGKRLPHLRSYQRPTVNDVGSPIRDNCESRSLGVANKNPFHKHSPISTTPNRQANSCSHTGTMASRSVIPIPTSTTNKAEKAGTTRAIDAARDRAKTSRLIEKAKKLTEKAHLIAEEHERLKMMEIASAVTATAKWTAEAEQNRLEAENHAKLAAFAADGAQLHLKRVFELMGERTGLLGKVQGIWRNIRH